ncbi:uncharacterized protein LOC127867715 isoform X2 [Dreissena polymorpha]|uniref:uncharacterized protein LOC127867715 isoform X2 n=1 Tax=Dreissena polymorpha TaxID=45954 RepID=UPI00226422BF|nr:uncharacterized protein LOC127867715 isoform X2 [Dreissena polymorpha]
MASISVKGFFAILGVSILLTSPREVDGLDCLACTGLPYPGDCNQRIKCTSTEKCSIEQVVTQGGVIAYNMGCKATQSCPGTKRGSSASQNFVDFVSRNDVAADVTSDFEAEDGPIVVCSECCNSKNYCNIMGCGAIDATPKNRQLCAKCDDVLTPLECESLQLCPDNQVCFTEFINLNGAERYRLGCTQRENCGANSTSTASSAPEVSLIGKRQNNEIPTFLKYCAKCCDNAASGVCNTELCSRDGAVPTGTVVKELQNPPPRNDFCSDLLSNACPALILDQPALCLETRYKHFGCRESCGTCVNPDQGGNANTSQHAVGPSDCFYNSMEYMGAYRHTYTNKRCIKWEDIGRPLGTFPDVNITYAENKCRDPNGLRGHPWCYVAPDKWEFCPVPFCQECYYSDRSHQYNGHVSTAEGGGKCETWAAMLAGNPSLKPEMFPDYNVSAANNYCRDPYKTGRPQCVVGAHRTNCSIPICNGPCQDRNTDVNCNLVSSFVCPSPYLSLTQCAKTCENCNVGVLPNVAKEPPAVVCEDNPMASCSLLSSLVCQNETTAINLCPKTCDVCDKLYGISTTTSLVTMNSQQTTSQMTTMTTPTNMPTSTTTLSTTTLTPTATKTITTSPTTTTVTTTTPTTTTTTSSTTTPTTTTITPPHWLEWGPWNCTFLENGCFQTRKRNYSTLVSPGNLSSDPYEHEVQPCNVNDCPVPCEDTINCTAVNELNELNPCQTGLGPKACPKTCHLCESGCFDLLNCSSEGAQAFFCRNEEDAIIYCRKTCKKCDKYPKPVTLNQCMDPVASPSVCYTLHKEICICDDESIKSICEGYCDGACGGTIRRNDTNIGCHTIDQKKRRELLTRLIH